MKQLKQLKPLKPLKPFPISYPFVEEEREPLEPFPALQAKGAAIQYRRRMEAVGITPPEKKPRGNFLISLLKNLDRARNVNATLVSEYILKRQPKEGFWDIARRGWRLEEQLFGQQLLDIWEESRGREPYKPQDFVGKASKWILGFAIDYLLDPISWITFGSVPLAKRNLAILSPKLQARLKSNVLETFTAEKVAEVADEITRTFTLPEKIEKGMSTTLKNMGVANDVTKSLTSAITGLIPKKPQEIVNMASELATVPKVKGNLIHILRKYSGAGTVEKTEDWISRLDNALITIGRDDEVLRTVTSSIVNSLPTNPVALGFLSDAAQAGLTSKASKWLLKHLREGVLPVDADIPKAFLPKLDNIKSIFDKYDALLKSQFTPAAIKHTGETMTQFTEEILRKVLTKTHAGKGLGMMAKAGELTDDIIPILNETLEEVLPIATRAKYHPHLKFAGAPIFDIAPVKTALGGQIKRLPFLTRIQNSIGDAFGFWYAPAEVSVEKREHIIEAKRLVADKIFQGHHNVKVGAENIATEILTKTTDALGDVARDLRKLAAFSYDRAEDMAEYIKAAKVSEDQSIWKAMSKIVGEDKLNVFVENVDGLTTKAGEVFRELGDNYFKMRKMDLKARNINMKFFEDRYLPIIFPDPDDKGILTKVMHFLKPKMPGAKAGFMNVREVYKSVEDAIKKGAKPITDLAQIMGVYEMMYQQSVAIHELEKMIRNLPRRIAKDVIFTKADISKAKAAKAKGLPYNKAVEGAFLIDDILPKLSSKGNYYISREVGKTIANLRPYILQEPEAINSFFDGYKWLTTQWKRTVLFRPGFLQNNAFGIILLNIADGMTNPLRYLQAIALELGLIDHIVVDGYKMSRKEFLFNFDELAMRGAGATLEVFHRPAMSRTAKEIIDEFERSGFDRVIHAVKDPRKPFLKMAEEMDTIGKMANIIHHLDEGYDWASAAHRTRIALFDYKFLTDNEKYLRDRIFPFYAWTRFALPRMMETLLSNPKVLTGSAHAVRNFFHINEVGLDKVSDWLRDTMAAPISVDDEGNVFYLKWNLPMSELSRIHDPREVREQFREIALMTNPLLSSFFQVVFNRHVLMDRQLQKYEWESAPLVYGSMLINQLGLTREVMLGIRLAKERAEYEQQILEGETPEIPPRRLGLPWSLLGAWQHPATFGRSELYEERRRMEQYKDYLETKGIEIPKTEEIPELPGGRVGEIREAIKARTVISPPIRKVPVVLRQAIKMAGVGIHWLPYLDRDMIKLSKGNPVAFSKEWYDDKGNVSKSRLGVGWYQRQGLFMMTKPEFEKYKMKGYNNIFDPLDSTLAYVNMLKARGMR